MEIRKIKKVITGSTQFDGAGVKLVRVFGYNDTSLLDPFLMMDAFDSEDSNDYTKGFPWHPHRGIETVTYLIHGDIDHSDSLGNKGSILDGCCQWMTAGSGILHQEMPQAADRMLGVQLWLNLPQKDKMVEPQYRDIRADMVPKVEKDGARVGIISGSYDGVTGSTQGDYVKATFLDVDLEPGTNWHLDTNPEDTLFIYVVDGEGYFEESTLIPRRYGVIFSSGDRLEVQASNKGMRLLVIYGKPLNEPIAWGGPIVMNTQTELKQAFDELDKGTFIK